MLIAQTNPSDRFLIQNAGNIIPPYGGMGVSIEYAVSALNVEHIIVYGYTNCGAVKSLMNRVKQTVEALRQQNLPIYREPFETPGCWIAVVGDTEGNSLMLHKIHPDRKC